MSNYVNTLATSKCDTCGIRRQGAMLEAYGCPVLFTCAVCDPGAFWAALATEWNHIVNYVETYVNVEYADYDVEYPQDYFRDIVDAEWPYGGAL